MKTLVTGLLIAALVAFVTFSASGQAPAQQRRGFLAVLKEGQSVTLKEIDGRFAIILIEDAPELAGYKVVEVGTDYCSVEDVAGVMQTRISVYSIKSIATIKHVRKAAK